MLLDRRPDVFLARRSGAEGFVVKPLDPQRVRAAVRALLRGEEYEDESLRPATVRAGSADAAMSDQQPPPSGLARLRARIAGRHETRPTIARGRGDPRRASINSASSNCAT